SIVLPTSFATSAKRISDREGQRPPQGRAEGPDWLGGRGGFLRGHSENAAYPPRGDSTLLIPVHVEPAVRLVKPALDIAAKHHRAVYDALFVALCQDLGLQGVTAA